MANEPLSDLMHPHASGLVRERHDEIDGCGEDVRARSGSICAIARNEDVALPTHVARRELVFRS